MARAPLTPITAPPPAPPRVSLLGTFAPTQVAEREVGFTFFPESCGDSGVGDPTACNTDHDKAIPDSPARVEVEPFYVWAGDKCEPSTNRDWQGRARRQLASTLSFQTAREFWTGDQVRAQNADTPNRWLASEDSDVLTAGPTTVVDAIALLEYGLGDCAHGPRGVIHVTLETLTHMAAATLVRREGNLLLTIADTIVVADAGYNGSGPYGAASDGSAWIYATGIPIVRMSPEVVIPDTLAQSLNRATNLAEYRAERIVAAGWDGCCHLAAEVNLPAADIAGAGS